MEGYDRVYYGFCYKCFDKFKTRTIIKRKYVQCTRCHSLSTEYASDLSMLKPRKRLAMCPKCYHIWFLVKQEHVGHKRIYAQCPACYKNAKRQSFFSYFTHNLYNHEEKLLSDLRLRFPEGYQRIRAGIQTYSDRLANIQAVFDHHKKVD